MALAPAESADAFTNLQEKHSRVSVASGQQVTWGGVGGGHFYTFFGVWKDKVPTGPGTPAAGVGPWVLVPLRLSPVPSPGLSQASGRKGGLGHTGPVSGRSSGEG